VELSVGHLGPALEVGISVRLTDSDPAVCAPDEVGPDDHSSVVVLEPLGGVDAANLTKPGRVGGPQRRRGSPTDRAIAAEVPRSGPVIDDDVGHEGPVLARVAPRPAVAGRHASAVAGFVAR